MKLFRNLRDPFTRLYIFNTSSNTYSIALLGNGPQLDLEVERQQLAAMDSHRRSVDLRIRRHSILYFLTRLNSTCARIFNDALSPMVVIPRIGAGAGAAGA